jgi:hypothetical protein
VSAGTLSLPRRGTAVDRRGIGVLASRLGAVIGIGGITAALLGGLADAAGLTPVLMVIAALPLPALACALALPRAG